MTATSSTQQNASGRIEFRPPILENAWLLGALSAFAAVFIGLGLLAHTWSKGTKEMVYWAILVFGFGVFPWIYVQTALLWLDSEQIGLRYAVVWRTVPRHRINRVVGTVGRIRFLDAHGKTVLNAPRFWSDDQVRSLCAHLGLQAEGIAKYLGGQL